MNKKKREKLDAACGLLDKAYEIIDDVSFDEHNCLDNMPENLQSSERYEQMEAACENLDDAKDSIDNARDSLYSAME